MSRSPTPDSVRSNTLELRGNRSATKYWYADGTSSNKFAFLRLGLPLAGYVMLVAEFIPTFLHFALTHFHVSYSGFQEDPAYTYWFSLSAVVSAAPTIFIIAILSDGYVYGKLASTMICLFLLCVTGVCTVLVTLEGTLSKSTRDVMARVAPFSIFFFFITIPLRVTVFTDIIAKTKDYRKARKAFTAFWISNLLGAAFGLALYKHVYDVGGPMAIFHLTIWLASLCVLYFAVASIITMSVPLELPFSNLFLHHLHCFIYAIKNQTNNRTPDVNNKTHWMDVALIKYSKTEVKRTRAIYHLAVLSVPCACCTACSILVPQVWYGSREYHVLFHGIMDDLAGFYLFLILLVLFSVLVQFVLMPIASYFKILLKEYWLLATGYLMLGIPLLMLLFTEIQCAVTNPPFEDLSRVRIVNGYDETVVVSCEWLGTDEKKKNATVLLGHVLTMSVHKDRLDSAEAVILSSDLILKDHFVLSVEPQTTKTYFMSHKRLDTILNISDADLQNRGGNIGRITFPTLVLTCQEKYWGKKILLNCCWLDKGKKIYTKKELLCRYEERYVEGQRYRKILPTILHYPPNRYNCELLSQENRSNQFHLPVRNHNTVHLHLVDSQKAETLTGIVKSSSARAPVFIRTDVINFENCLMNDKLFHAQIVLQAFSTAILLVDANTIYCIHAPPRLRMISFALLWGAAFTGYIIHRLLYISNWSMVTITSSHVVLYLIGLIHHVILAFRMSLDLHSWDESWRPSIIWKIRLWIRNTILYKNFLSEKGPALTEPPKRDRGILQTEVEKDKRMEDEKMAKRVTFDALEFPSDSGNTVARELAK